MKELAPADTKAIELLCSMIRKFAKYKPSQGKPYELYNILDIVRMIFSMRPYMKLFKFCTNISMVQFAERFSDPLIREVFPMSLADKDMSLIAFVGTMALLHNKGGGFPEGGSLEFSRAIETRFKNLGGKIFYGKKVEKILVNNDTAQGIRLANGEEIMADYVISCADLNNTLYKMLDGKYIDPQHEELFKSAKIFNSSVQVSFGVNMNFTSEPDCIAQIYKLETPIMIGNQNSEWFIVRNYSFDPTLAPEGKTVIECTFMVEDFDYWEKLYIDKEAYKAEKERIATSVTAELEKKYPGFTSAIEVTDVLSPMTYVRFTGNYRGSYMTWVMTPDLMRRHRMVKKSLPGLRNFWLSGMWVQPPGGVPSGAKTSRDILQIICREAKRKFVTSKF
jgi:phytoene dehydrogenase-like protein